MATIFSALIRLQHVGDERSVDLEAAERDRRVSDVVEREQSRLRSFIRRRVADPRDVDDILQEVFSELVEANRRFMPIDHISGWLFRVARNRITELFRRTQAEAFSDSAGRNDEPRMRATFLPRFLGAGMVLAGVGYLPYLYPPLGNSVYPYNLVLGVGELALVLWLAIRGVDAQRWQERARIAEVN